MLHNVGFFRIAIDLMSNVVYIIGRQQHSIGIAIAAKHQNFICQLPLLRRIYHASRKDSAGIVSTP